jgi:predicted metal-binding membrane protein
MHMGATDPWSAAYLASTLLMWIAMMAAMMLPSATPMLRVVATTNRSLEGTGGATAPTGVMALGYVAAWSAFSLAATLLQAELRSRSLLSPSLALINARLGASVVLAAGAYQFTPFKAQCLIRCRSPFSLLLNGWRDGLGGALVMGLREGTNCVACCWALMLVLFATGVMNTLWVAILALAVLVEKLAPDERWPRWMVGSGVLAFGLFLAWRSL